MQTKNRFIEGTHHQLELWGDQFALLEQKIEYFMEKERGPLRRKLEDLRRKKRSLKRRLREAAHQGPEKRWEDVREPLEDAVKDFRSLAGEVYDKLKVAQ